QRPLERSPLQKRYETYIAYGNQLRAQFNDALLATTAVRRVMSKRLRLDVRAAFSSTVFLIHQFKRKEEIDFLRAIYDRLLFQVSVYSRRGVRVDYLSRKFANTNHSSDHMRYRAAAEELIQID